ncbi:MULTISPECIES: MFS transporter [Streptomyces]|uniref:MFS transporter n=1 Tax=Streptomyces TaxID=1883 RepID=UPI000BDA1661|nr:MULTISPECIES: MFS transporter [unclassified Streptomyces]NMI56858.1 MFS transporter [Streptomyces sp. RLA2-12]QDN56249.1 MFS transporter [Streptomyces sp. S1D4-20]QDN66426.1 MFS transporter [Streptomyces sp. S1D4-14]QDO48834.1 MFS transporter [Streptomyces sp. RLB3-5]QDO59074.1 MFS transporter [Streptomyces sp. RLB1-8]
MSTTPPPQALTTGTHPGTDELTSDDGALAWLRALGPQGRRAFAGAFGGYALDSYDYFTLPLSMVALAAYFGLDSGQTGLFTTVTLVVSAVGGAIAGVVADRIGRVKALMITVITYAVFTVACGFAPNYETLLVFRALQGLGFGGEWAVGAILVAEYSSARHRGRTLGAIQSSWAVGWGLAVVVYTLVFQFLGDDLAWRVMFWTGALPALLVVWVRRRVQDAPEAAAVREKSAEKGSFVAIFKPASTDGPGLLRTTFFAVLLSTGVQGGYYTLATWVPTYLKTERGLSVVGTGSYLTFLISGAFIGYLTGGYLTDKLGRKRNILLFAILSAACILTYANIPSGANTLLLVLGFPLGFCMSAIFSGFGSFLSELYPSAVRGTGQGFTYNTGRAVGAAFPTTVGFLADSWGVGGALVFGAIGYALAALALIGLPETRGKELL